jgi:hypothetical protein
MAQFGQSFCGNYLGIGTGNAMTLENLARGLQIADPMETYHVPAGGCKRVSCYDTSAIYVGRRPGLASFRVLKDPKNLTKIHDRCATCVTSWSLAMLPEPAPFLERQQPFQQKDADANQQVRQDNDHDVFLTSLRMGTAAGYALYHTGPCCMFSRYDAAVKFAYNVQSFMDDGTNVVVAYGNSNHPDDQCPSDFAYPGPNGVCLYPVCQCKGCRCGQ